MMKKAVALLLAATMVFTIAGCGRESEKKTSGDDKKTEKTDDKKDEGGDKAASGDADMSNLKGLKIGFSQCDNANSWRIAETESMQETAKKYGVDLVYTDASGDIAKQASDIQDMVAQGVDYIVLAPQEEDGLQAALKSAMKAGIGVILVDRGVNGKAGEDYTSAIMSDFVWEAEQVAKKVIDTTSGKGNVVIIQGTQGATSTIDRQKGFTEAIKGTDLKVVADQVGDYEMAKGQSVMENILQAQGKDIDVVFCHNDDMALGAITAIKAAGYEPGKDIYVCSVDGSKSAMEAIVAGELLATCSCTPKFGPIAFETISKLEAGQDVPAEITNEDTLYDKSNAKPELGF